MKKPPTHTEHFTDIWPFEARTLRAVRVTFLGLFLTVLCAVEAEIVLPRDQCHWGEPLPRGRGRRTVSLLQGYLAGLFVSLGININARTRGLKGEYCSSERINVHFNAQRFY